MRMYRRGLGTTALAVAVCTATLGAGTAGASGTGKIASSGNKITFVEAGATPGRYLAYVATYGGFFREEGLNVSIVDAATGSQAAQLLAGDQADYELGQLSDALNTSVAGEPISMLANIYSRYANSIIVRSDQKATVKNFSNLGGIPFGITGVGSGTYQLANFAASLGNVSPSSLHLESIGGASINSGQGLASGAVDAQVSNDPTDLQLVKSGQAYFLADPMNMNNGVGRQYPAFKKLAGEQYVYNTLISTQSYIASHTTQTQKVLDALQLAANYVQHEPASKVGALIVRDPNEAPFGKALIAETVSDAVKVAHSLPKTLAMTSLAYSNTRSFASQLQSSYSSVAMSAVVNNSYANNALKAIGTTAVSLKQAEQLAAQKKKK